MESVLKGTRSIWRSTRGVFLKAPDPYDYIDVNKVHCPRSYFTVNVISIPEFLLPIRVRVRLR